MKRVIVFGGSAGGLESLCTILSGLPGDVAAALLAVIHTGENSGALPQVLSRCGSWEAVSPASAEAIASGKLFIAAPNRHLVVRSHCAVSWMGPRENRHRPAVDTLFRSAARVYRSHVIAVILSGAMDDGSAGALAVKARGGTVIVQDPGEAQFPDMPANALRQAGADYCVPAAEIPALLTRLVARSRAMKMPKRSAKECEAVGVNAGVGEREPSGLTCPDCGGVVAQIESGGNVQFRCHVGHNFSLQSFTEAQSDALERALWIVLRQLNEQRLLQSNLARGSGNDRARQKRFQETAAAAERDMKLLHQILARL